MCTRLVASSSLTWSELSLEESSCNNFVKLGCSCCQSNSSCCWCSCLASPRPSCLRRRNLAASLRIFCIRCIRLSPRLFVGVISPCLLLFDLNATLLLNSLLPLTVVGLWLFALAKFVWSSNILSCATSLHCKLHALMHECNGLRLLYLL